MLSVEALVRVVLTNKEHLSCLQDLVVEDVATAHGGSPSAAAFLYEQLDAIATASLEGDALRAACGVDRLHEGAAFCRTMLLEQYLKLPVDERPTFARVEEAAGPDLVGCGTAMIDGEESRVVVFIKDTIVAGRAAYNPRKAACSLVPSLFYMNDRTSKRKRHVPLYNCAMARRVAMLLRGQLRSSGRKKR